MSAMYFMRMELGRLVELHEEVDAWSSSPLKKQPESLRDGCVSPNFTYLKKNSYFGQLSQQNIWLFTDRKTIIDADLKLV